jgi:glycosyltransferase involved in cell wall biosynthesis
MLQAVQTGETRYSGGSRETKIKNEYPLVSVVCVTYNAAKILPNLMQSVRDYKTDEVEFVVVDGSSTDGTIDVLKDNRDIIDFWISRPDEGIYDAMNESLKYVKGQWVVFLGSDDLLLNGFTAMLGILKDPDTIYYGDLLFYGKDFFKVYDDYYLTKLNICQQAIFYPRKVFDKYRFDLKYKVYADYHLNLRCWKDEQFNFSHANHVISRFSDGGYSSYENDYIFEEDKEMLFKRYLKRSSYYRYLNREFGFWTMLRRLVQNK